MRRPIAASQWYPNGAGLGSHRKNATPAPTVKTPEGCTAQSWSSISYCVQSWKQRSLHDSWHRLLHHPSPIASGVVVVGVYARPGRRCFCFGAKARWHIDKNMKYWYCINIISYFLRQKKSKETAPHRICRSPLLHPFIAFTSIFKHTPCQNCMFYALLPELSFIFLSQPHSLLKKTFLPPRS